jgi:hypothetical protein
LEESNLSLRTLLSQQGSYPIIAANMGSWQLPRFPVALFGHVRDVYQRVETAADHPFNHIEELRLAALVHEQPQELLPKLLDSAGVLDLLPAVVAVIGGFGRIWKVTAEDDLHNYVEANRPYLAAILLFELAHEGQSTPAMERAAKLGGLQPAFERWAGRLAEAPR